MRVLRVTASHNTYVMPLPELAALGPAYGAWPRGLLKEVALLNEAV